MRKYRQEVLRFVKGLDIIIEKQKSRLEDVEWNCGINDLKSLELMSKLERRIKRLETLRWGYDGHLYVIREIINHKKTVEETRISTLRYIENNRDTVSYWVKPYLEGAIKCLEIIKNKKF